MRSDGLFTPTDIKKSSLCFCRSLSSDLYTSNKTPVRRWTIKRKSAVVIDIFKGKATSVEIARLNDLMLADVEGWIEEAQRSVENGFHARPRDIREQCEKEQQETREALGGAHLQTYALKKFKRLLDNPGNS